VTTNVTFFERFSSQDLFGSILTGLFLDIDADNEDQSLQYWFCPLQKPSQLWLQVVAQSFLHLPAQLLLQPTAQSFLHLPVQSASQVSLQTRRQLPMHV
jgi:hypothetical protein